MKVVEEGACASADGDDDCVALKFGLLRV